MLKYCAFENNGAALRIDTPFPPNTWDNLLINKEYFAEVNQRMEASSITIADKFVRSNLMPKDNRFFINVGGKAYRMCRGEGENYTCVHTMADSRVEETFDGVATSIRAFVPTTGPRMFWTAELENTTDELVEVDFFSMFHFSIDWLMSFSSRFDKENNGMYCTGFPYHVKYEDKVNLEPTVHVKYVLTDAEVTSFEGNAQRFYGYDDYGMMPKAVEARTCLNKECELEQCYSIMHHRYTLKPGEKKTINYMMGRVKEMSDLAQCKKDLKNIDKFYAETVADWQDISDAYHIDTPNAELDALVNHWLKKQVRRFVYTNRGGPYCCTRNQMQDLMGYSLIRPKDAFEFFVKLLARQHISGYYKQHQTLDDSPPVGLCNINASDAYLWLILCGLEVLENNADPELYNYKVGYMDSPVKHTILEHLRKAAYFMFGQTGEHGLCLLLDGDWTDPINGPGREGRGESTWNSVGLIYAVDRLNKIHFDPTLDRMSREMKETVNKWCWDGEWYIAGYDDFGKPYGTVKDEEGKIFLNSQTWTIMAGVAEGERLEKAHKAVEKYLQNEYGYKVVWPSFSKWNPVWGKISIKQQGTTENGSVYNHAVMFKAYSDVVRGDSDLALETIEKILPTRFDLAPDEDYGNPIQFSNYYFADGAFNHGRVNSAHYSTGTTAWCIWVVVSQMFGFQNGSQGMKILPKLPKSWANASATLRIGGHVYEVKAENGVCTMTADGKKI